MNDISHASTMCPSPVLCSPTAKMQCQMKYNLLCAIELRVASGLCEALSLLMILKFLLLLHVASTPPLTLLLKTSTILNSHRLNHQYTFPHLPTIQYSPLPLHPSSLLINFRAQGLVVSLQLGSSGVIRVTPTR